MSEGIRYTAPQILPVDVDEFDTHGNLLKSQHIMYYLKQAHHPVVGASAVFLDALSKVYMFGETVKPRGVETRELLGYQMRFPAYSRFISLVDRNLNYDYIRREVLWYLRGNRFDTSIARHAKIWRGLEASDGGFNSNYGQFLFPVEQECIDQLSGELRKRPLKRDRSTGVFRALDTLARDETSRRALVMILSQAHLDAENKDYPCTCSLNFSVRQDDVHLQVHMRSQDIIFGLGNDLPTFSIMQEIVSCLLSKKLNKTIWCGDLTITADSLHVYSRHYEMAEKILKNQRFFQVEIPRIKVEEAVYLLEETFTALSYDLEYAKTQEEIDELRAKVPDDYLFTKWLTDVKPLKED